jgi:hypothetical protein
MKRMKCIGAQSVEDLRVLVKPTLRPLTRAVTPRTQRLMVLRPCRRNAGSGIARSYATVLDEAAQSVAAQQLSLFSE